MLRLSNRTTVALARLSKAARLNSPLPGLWFRFQLLACLAIATLAAIPSSAVRAGVIYGTGEGATLAWPPPADANWKLVAGPAGWTPPTGPTYPTNVYVVPEAPLQFVGGGWPLQAGVTTDGITNFWVAPSWTVTSLITSSFDGENPYNWIIAQDFQIETSGEYRFEFIGAGDNELEFFLNGEIGHLGGDLNRPIITGGTQIGTKAGSFTTLSSFTGTANLDAGTHTAYMVLWDYGGATGALISRSSFSSTSAVPEPGSVGLVGSIVVAAITYRRRRQAANAVLA